MTSKFCGLCGTTKGLTEFGRDKVRKDGLNPYCRACICARSRATRLNPGYLEKHNSWRRAARKTPRGRASRLLTDARTRHPTVTITLDWVDAKLKAGLCEVTGLPLDLDSNGAPAAPFTPSLDQRQPGLGYTPENTQVVVWIYNRSKGVNDHSAVMRMSEALCRA